tara:strand:+ start:5195 stop:5716 length:522 start_codon:yes stop_codon:yes gene_type:complete
MQKSSWIFGALAGILSATLEYLFFKSSESNANTMFLSKILILTLCIVLGLILAKKLLGGTISIARTILTGGVISIVRAIVMIIAFMVLYFPNGEFYQSKVEIAFEQAAKKVQQDDEIKPADKAMELKEIKNQIAAQYKPAGYAMMSIGSSLVTGLIVSILMAAFIANNMMYKQ